jgi:hypothetical protein
MVVVVSGVVRCAGGSPIQPASQPMRLVHARLPMLTATRQCVYVHMSRRNAPLGNGSSVRRYRGTMVTMVTMVTMMVLPS